jgi:hypothetical protein
MKRVAVALISMLHLSTAHADRRAYGTTYEAVTAPRGELDVETWSTYTEAGELDGGPASRGVREMVELEYGITDRWDAALYNRLDIVSGDTKSGYAGFKIETRYRPTDRGEWVVDPVFYLELQQLFIGDAKQKLEAKLIVAKDFGPVNTAVNIAVEEERLEDKTWNTEIEYAAGVSYAFSPAWIVGAETFGKAEKEMDEIENRTWVGPAVSWAGGGSGALRGVWVTLAGGAGLTEGADAYYARLIVGLQFH